MGGSSGSDGAMDRLNNSMHGGNVYEAARALRRPVSQLVDFSASVNPLGPSPRALQAITRACRLLQHYPDPDCVALRQALASRWRCDPGRIVLGNGSTELIHLFPTALRLRHLLVVGPTFSEYAKAMQKCGGRVSTVLAERADGYRPPVVRAIQAMGQNGRRRRGSSAVDAVVLCNPNSPTGQACDQDDVINLARVCERRGVQVIIDETFADYCEERSVMPLIHRIGRVTVLRSFTKFFGLPGLRLGCLIAHPEIAQRVRSCQPPWSVNTLAQEAGLAALEDRRYMQLSRSFMTRERARFSTLLEALPGCRVFPSNANFLLMELPREGQVREVTVQLRREGLLIRDCSAVPGLNGRSIRIAVRKRSENNRLVRALSYLLR